MKHLFFIIILLLLLVLLSCVRYRTETFIIQSPKIAYITSIYGNYETTCKPFKTQTIPSDFICFTNNKNIKSNGWIIDNNEYHITNPNPIDTGIYINSLSKNKHNFNIAKYYKQSFQHIPRLQEYDIILWLDGTIEIVNEYTSEIIVSIINKKHGNIIVFEHEHRQGSMEKEVKDSHIDKYTNTFWNNQEQPYQDIDYQFKQYVNDGYSQQYWETKLYGKKNAGMWITCFVAFNMKNKNTNPFLDTWYLQTLKFTTQDQIGFPYALFTQNLIPYSLPNDDIKGEFPHIETDFYKKLNHGS